MIAVRMPDCIDRFLPKAALLTFSGVTRGATALAKFKHLNQSN
jgi:hypothetical protein